MFSPATTNTPAASARTSRRRQRPLSNEGSISQPKAKRQRSALTDQTYEQPSGYSPEMAETKASKPLAISRQEIVRESGPQRDIVVRGKKPRPADRHNKADGNTVLTTNDTYTVSKLLAVPEGLLANTTSRQHGDIHSESGYALTLTHTHATAWLYQKNVSPPTSYTFEIPHPSKHNSDPLPLGSLVSPPASSPEPGLVVVVPKTGKITYWESVTSAATMGLRLQRNGVEDVVKLHSGETVVQILNAETAGFVLAFSTGRIAYMNVRDEQNRPAISVKSIDPPQSQAVGIFGSLRNKLPTFGLREDIAAVRADRPEKSNERNLVVATSKGKIRYLDMPRSGTPRVDHETHGREVIVQAIKQAIPTFSELLIENFELLDLTYLPREYNDKREAGDGVQLLLLTSLTERDNSHYFLIEVTLQGGNLDIMNIRPIKTYKTPVNKNATSKPRLYLPNPIIAFVVFDRAAVLVSMTTQMDSPDWQLGIDGRLTTEPFEDVVGFRREMDIEIVGSGMEEPYALLTHKMDGFKRQGHGPKYSGVVLLVRGVGIVRIAATDVKRLTSPHQQVTAKSKLEQAVFFASVDKNPINFALKPEMQFPDGDISEAALELSLDILKSETPHIPSVPAKVIDNLAKRSVALRDIARYLKTNGVQLDRATRWRLLWDAEKMAAATTIWNEYDARISAKPKGQKRGLITDIVESIHEDYKTEPVAEDGELDRVRHWFIKDVDRLDLAGPWAFQVIKHAWHDGQKDHDSVAELLSEANDVIMGVLQTAFKFRTANVELYGLQGELLEHGILKSNYEGLPEFWTSTKIIVDALRKQITLAHNILKMYGDKPEKPGKPSADVISKLRNEHSTLIDVAIRSSNERVRYCLAYAQDSPQYQIEAEQLKAAQEEAQKEQIVALAGDLSLAEEAMALAEKHEILETLAYVTMFQLNVCTSKSNRGDDDAKQRQDALGQQIDHFFAKFGKKWATAFYQLQISIGAMTTLLDDFKEQQTYLTSFLREKPEYAKVAWMNEIISEKDFDQAANNLFDLGLKREQDVWSKKVELSIGKLARLAGRNRNQQNGRLISDEAKIELAAAQDQLELTKIQDTVYGWIVPAISEAIDENAELDLALGEHSFKELKDQPTFSSFLHDQMANLVNHRAMDVLSLIDLLTLMDDNAPLGEESYRYQQFYLALQATRYGISDKNERTLVQRVIWRRCMLRDNWSEVNDTDGKDDRQVSERLSYTALYQTFRACLKNGLFDKSSAITPMSPEEIAGACTDELDHRFTGLDDSIQDRVMKDYQKEDNQFIVYSEKSRLNKWYVSALDQAKQDFAEAIAEETEDGKNMIEARDELENIEASIAQKEMGKAEGLLRAKTRHKPKVRANGGAGSFRTSIMQY